MKSVQQSELATTRLGSSRKRGTSPSLVLLSIILLGANLLLIRAAEKVRVLTVSSQTADFVVFQISSTKRFYGLAEDVVINYTVRNNSGKTIYLVLESKPRVSVDQERYLLRMESPVKYADEFTEYDNDLIRVLPRKSFSGKLVIKPNEIPRDKESESEEWYVLVGFSYVLNPSSLDVDYLRLCKRSRNSLPCLGKLFRLSKTLTVGNLLVEVKNH